MTTIDTKFNTILTALKTLDECSLGTHPLERILLCLVEELNDNARDLSGMVDLMTIRDDH